MHTASFKNEQHRIFAERKAPNPIVLSPSQNGMHDEDSDSVPWPATRNNTQYGLRPGGGGLRVPHVTSFFARAPSSLLFCGVRNTHKFLAFCKNFEEFGQCPSPS